MHVDSHTLSITLTVSSLLQVAALFTQSRTIKDGRGLGWWTLGAVGYTLAFICTYLRDDPAWGGVAFIFSVTFFISGMTLHYLGVQRFLGQEVRGRSLATLCLFTIVSVIHLTFGTDDPAARIAVASMAMAIISLMLTRSLLCNLAHAGSASLPLADFVTASLGVATTYCSGELSQAELVAQADELLYKAKQLGRNQVACSGPEAAPPAYRPPGPAILYEKWAIA